MKIVRCVMAKQKRWIGPPYIVGMLLIYCYQKLLFNWIGQNEVGIWEEWHCIVVCCLLFQKCGSFSNISILPIELL